MVAMEALKLLSAGNRRRQAAAAVAAMFLPGLVFPLYITRADEAVEHEPADIKNHSYL